MSFDLKKYEKYNLRILGNLQKGALTPFCILCGRIENMTCKALWVDEEKETVIAYSLCDDCAKELLKSPESQRTSIIQKVIETKITALSTLSHQKMSDLIRKGVKIEF
jgi:hypothetical protein